MTAPGGARDAAETIPVRPGESFDVEAVERYLRQHLEGLPEGSLEVRQFPAGASNLTYLIRLGDWEVVLRRPPVGPLPPKAHDMGREAFILSRLHPVFPLAPRPLVVCADPAVMGAPFYVMERRLGVLLDRHFPPGVEPDPDLCRRISHLVVDTLVQLHEVDYRAAGLDEIGRPEGFLERQVRGWIERYERAKTEHIPEVERLKAWLTANVPASTEATVIHNDFKLNNMLLSDDFRSVNAVLDWEMATVGDPLFDLGVTLSYWVTADDPPLLRGILPTVTATPGFISRETFIQRYAQRSGRDVSAVDFYLTFAYFKLAVIIQQIYYRWKRGRTQDERFASFGEGARQLIVHAAGLIAS